jgi:hypothetical protein
LLVTGVKATLKAYLGLPWTKPNPQEDPTNSWK